MVNRRVRGFGFNLALTAGVLLGLAFLAKRFNVGSQIAEGARGLGQTTGLALTNPFAGLVEGVNLGAQDIFKQGGIAGANFQEALTGNRNAIGDFFAGVPENKIENQPPPLGERLPRLAVNLTNSSAISQRRQNVTSTNQRFTGTPTLTQDLINIGVTGSPSSSNFGGFGTAENQENALQRLIAENAKKFSTFFG